MSLKSLHRLLADGRPADHPVCHDGQGVVAWREFSTRVAAHAAHFAARREQRWLLAADDPLDFVVRLLALLHAGKQVVIPPNTQTGTLAQLAAAFDARADDAASAQAGPLARAAATAALLPIAASTTIIDLYTSGSTGHPKRVRKTLAQFDAEIAVLEGLWGPTLGQASIVASAPHQHIYGLLFRLLWPLATGRPFDTTTCADPDTLAERLALLHDSALVSSPAQLARLPDLLPLSSLQPAPKVIFSSGGPLPACAALQFQRQLGLAPIEVFGSTETGGIAWRCQAGQTDGDAWTPLPGIRVSRGDDGALLLYSPFLAAGADATDAPPWRADDTIELCAAGRFRLGGRLDRIVKIEEKRLSLPDMEARLLAHRWVNSVAVLALPGPRQRVGAVVVLGDEGRREFAVRGRRDAAQHLREHLAVHFDAVLLPRRWRFLDRLPIDARGKLPHEALLDLFDDGANRVGAVRDETGTTAQFTPHLLGVRTVDGGRHHLVLDLHVPAGLAHFPGHFPDLPILPGVVQIDWALRYAREHLAPDGPQSCQFVALEKIKFLALVLPDARLELTLKWDAENTRLDFSFATSERRCSSGRVVFGGGP